MFETLELFRNDAYLKQCEAKVLAIDDNNGVVLNQTVFYPTGGGQPGDSGILELNEQKINVTTTIKNQQSGNLNHIIAENAVALKVGDRVIAKIDWQKRYLHMKMHSALHLLCAVVPCGVTGGQIGTAKSRLDFDIGETTLNKEEITTKLNQLISENHQISSLWISPQELDENPELVRTMSVQPPKSGGKIRLLKIGESIDLQPCGGTHIKTTNEIGSIRVSKIENKGKRNRRVNLVFSG